MNLTEQIDSHRFLYLIEIGEPQDNRGRAAEAQRLLLISPREFKAVATHVSIVLRNHYFGRHETTRISRIPAAGDFVSTR